MSIEAIAWTFKQDVKPSSLKFLLVAIANYTNSEWKMWASVEALTRITGQDRKTIIAGISELELQNFISDSGARVGKTKSVKVYYFNHPEAEHTVQAAIPKTEQLKQSHISVEAVPKTDGSSTENGNPPAPPILKNLLKNQERTFSAKAKKISLEQWEEKTGSILRVEQMASWVKENRFDAAKVSAAVTEFRGVMKANGNQYADFIAAFQNYVRRGYLSVSAAALALPAVAEPVAKFETYDRGVNL